MIIDGEQDSRAGGYASRNHVAESSVFGTGAAEASRSKQPLLRMGRTSQKDSRASSELGR